MQILKGLVLVRNEAAYPAIQRAIDVLGSTTEESSFKNAVAHSFGVLGEYEKGKAQGRSSHLTQKVGLICG